MEIRELLVDRNCRAILRRESERKTDFVQVRIESVASLLVDGLVSEKGNRPHPLF